MLIMKVLIDYVSLGLFFSYVQGGPKKTGPFFEVHNYFIQETHQEMR